MQVTGLGWMGVITEDFSATLEFFAQILGLSLSHRDESKELAHFRLQSGQLLEIFGPSNRQRKEKYRRFDGPALGFEVQNIEFARGEMIARGVNFITGIEKWQDAAWSMFLGPEDKLLAIEQAERRRPHSSAKLSRFSWAGIVMQDFEAALRFFSDVMNMPLEWRNDSRGLAHFKLPAGHILEIVDASQSWSRIMPHVAIGFEVEDVRQARAEMESNGVEFITKVVVTADGEAYTYFRGPDGYPYEILQP